MIADYALNQVRLARLDAFDVATVTGQFDGIVDGQVIVVNGTLLEAVSRSGSVKKLGILAGSPNWNGAGTVAVKPDLTQWIYSLTDQGWTAHIHVGTPTGDAVMDDAGSPSGYDFYQAFAWNASGIYLVREGTGLGGAGPFLEYHFPLARFDLATHRVTDVSPACPAYRVLDDGTMLCLVPATRGAIEIRSPSGGSHDIQLTKGSAANSDSVFARLSVSPDNLRVIVSRNGATDPVISYQMAVAAIGGSSATVFGPLDYIPDTWLPDGRVVADHQCVDSQWGGGPCDSGLDGTYIFSADGSSHVLFYKLKSGQVVAYI